MKNLYFAENRLVYSGGGSPSSHVSLDSHEALGETLKNSKDFALSLIKIKKQGNSYRADTKLLNKFLTMRGRNVPAKQKKIISVWLKRKNLPSGASDVKKIWEKVSTFYNKRSDLPRAKANHRRVTKWMRYAVDNAAEIGAKRAKEKAEKLVNTVNVALTPPVKSILGKYAPNKTKTDAGTGGQKVIKHPKLPKVTAAIKKYLKPKGIGLNVQVVGAGFKTNFTCSNTFNLRKLPKIKKDLSKLRVV